MRDNVKIVHLTPSQTRCPGGHNQAETTPSSIEYPNPTLYHETNETRAGALLGGGLRVLESHQRPGLGLRRCPKPVSGDVHHRGIGGLPAGPECAPALVHAQVFLALRRP